MPNSKMPVVMRKNVLINILIVGGFGVGFYLTLQAGKRLETARGPALDGFPTAFAAATPAPSVTAPDASITRVFQGLRDNLHDPLSLLLVQLILIVVLARAFGALFVKLGQPAVIGEMIAGIVLGPSVAGALFPGAFHFVFPAASLGALRMLSQVGIIMFMFVVGMELDVKHLRGSAHTAVMVSQAGIIFPYFLGVVFSFFIFGAYGSQNAGFPPFALFMGIAMSVTAFPVLARILEERGLTRTPLGSTAIVCAAVGDVSAWTILAFVVALVKAGNAAGALLTIFLLLIFVAGMLFGVKPLLHRHLPRHDSSAAPRPPHPGSAPETFAMELPLRQEMEERAGGEEAISATIRARDIQNNPALSPTLSHSCVMGEGEESKEPPGLAAPSRTTIVGILLLVFSAGLFTEVIGIHALFGAFLTGVIMPPEARFRLHLAERLESFSSAFLLPLFFAFTGLRTQVGLINDWESASVCLAIILVATLGKLGGSMVIARWTGMNWHDSFALGALMNTRGLVELIVLNIGLDLGILSPRVFTMMVIMALVTTCLTGPLLSLGNLLRRKTSASIRPRQPN